MDKEQLIKVINQGLRIEEETVPTLTNSISAAVNFLEKDDKIRTKILKTMDLLKNESEGHARLLNDLSKKVMKGEKNVY
jgi:hypothetical protein